MKEFLFVFAAMLPAFTLASSPDMISTSHERNAEPSWSASVNPFQLFLLSASGRIEMKVSDNLSLHVPIDFQVYPRSVLKTGDLLYTGAGLGARYYLTGTALKSGLFLDGTVAFGFSRIREENKLDNKAVFLRPSAVLGYRFDFGSGFALNAGVGLAYNHAVNEKADLVERQMDLLPKKDAHVTRILNVMQGVQSGFIPTGEISLAYAW